MKCSDKEWQHCQKEKRGCEGCAYNDEISIGEYVRTNWGHIGKLKRIELDKNDKGLKWYVFDHKEFEINIVKEEYINKPYIVDFSKNIKDILTNGDLITYKLKGLQHKCKGIIRIYKDARSGKEHLGIDSYSLEQIEILDIATKEQIKQIEFRIGD